ncbi:MAG: hypothetical protein GY796_07735, partial [Chloroflexi bacterium]|nr:hypothetical protein [Chloroflexota bacterium]
MEDSIGCHSAIIIWLAGQKWLVDVGFPLYAPLPISPHGTMYRSSEFLHYATYPDGRNRYQIEQWPHPKRNVFTLIDKPVSEAEYRAHTSRDYGEQGLFLDAVIINKIIRDQLWRFNMRERPWRLNCFHWGQRFDAELDGDPAAAVARHFGMDETTVQIAFECVS